MPFAVNVPETVVSALKSTALAGFTNDPPVAIVVRPAKCPSEPAPELVKVTTPVIFVADSLTTATPDVVKVISPNVPSNPEVNVVAKVAVTVAGAVGFSAISPKTIEVASGKLYVPKSPDAKPSIVKAVILVELEKVSELTEVSVVTETSP